MTAPEGEDLASTPGAAGYVIAGVVAEFVLLGEPSLDLWRLAVGVGACTAVGRAAVIPLVPVVRRRA